VSDISRSVFESAKVLSKSRLWSVQGEYFRKSGVQAWASGDVPHTLTSGPIVGRAYAQIVEGFVEDCRAGRFGRLDEGEPIYVVELGSGTGRLGFHFLRQLDEACILPFRVVYVLTDLAQSNVDFWRQHPKLAPYVDAGRLDFARFDATSDDEIRLEHSDAILTRTSVANPLVVVANYLFDVIPQDLYVRSDGQLFEELVAIVEGEDAAGSAGQGSLDPTAPDFFARLWIETSRRPAAPGPYADADLDELLVEVAAEHGAGAADRFLFPATALRCLGRLADLANDRLLVLSGERPGSIPDMSPENDGTTGAVRPSALLGLSVHGGSFSLPVDMGVIAMLAERRGGYMLMPSALPAGLLVTATMMGSGLEGVATAHRFRLAIDDLGPEDVFLAMRPALRTGLTEHPLAVLLALLRVGGYDPYLFRMMHAGLAAQLKNAEAAGIEEAARVFAQVWERYYAIDDETDVAFGIAALLAPAGRYADALGYLELSRASHGPRPLVAFNTALCRALLGDREGALEAVAEALDLDPDLAEAALLREQLVRPS